jgi:hypothetical protein
MNHVHFLHSGEMQNLHSIEMHFLHPGCLRAIFSFSPKGKFCIPANMQFLLSGVNAENAFRRKGSSCLKAIRRILHSGLHAKIAFRMLTVYNVWGEVFYLFGVFMRTRGILGRFILLLSAELVLPK